MLPFFAQITQDSTISVAKTSVAELGAVIRNDGSGSGRQFNYGSSDSLLQLRKTDGNLRIFSFYGHKV
jgi:hypothetical protein